MTEGAQNRLGFSAIGSREAKAKKIFAILAAAGRPLKPTHKVLDLGRLGEPVQLLSFGGLKHTAKGRSGRGIWRPRLLHATERYALNFTPRIAKLVRWLPSTLLNLTAGLQPILILLLHPR